MSKWKHAGSSKPRQRGLPRHAKHGAQQSFCWVCIFQWILSNLPVSEDAFVVAIKRSAQPRDPNQCTSERLWHSNGHASMLTTLSHEANQGFFDFALVLVHEAVMQHKLDRNQFWIWRPMVLGTSMYWRMYISDPTCTWRAPAWVWECQLIRWAFARLSGAPADSRPVNNAIGMLKQMSIS